MLTAATGVTIKIVDPETYTVMPEGEEGEIWVDSPCKALGYWEKEEKSQRVFEAQLDEMSDRTYLRTGDLGFIKGGELFMSGRLKNLIIIYGRKIHPSDIEMRIETSFTMLQPGRTVACEYTDEQMRQDSMHGKGIAYVAELRSPKSHTLVELDLLAKQIATMIGLNFQVEVSLVAFIKPRAMPCTTSGKRQRSLCKKKLLNNSLEEVYRWSRESGGVEPKPHQSQQLPCPLIAALNEATVDDSPQCELNTTVQVLTQPIDINILEASDSESNLEKPTKSESDGDQNSTDNATPSVVEQQREAELQEDNSSNGRTIEMLNVQYPDIVRTERRKSAPPLPVDRESQLMANRGNNQRRKSALEKCSPLSRLNKRRNSLQTITATVSGVLGVHLNPDSNIWAHGCNSIKVVQLSQCLQSEYGFAVEPHHLLMHQTPKALLGKLQRSLLSMSSPPSAGSNQSDENLAAVDECSAGESGLDTLLEDVDEGEDRETESSDTDTVASRQGQDIAIVGMACTFAGKYN